MPVIKPSVFMGKLFAQLAVIPSKVSSALVNMWGVNLMRGFNPPEFEWKFVISVETHGAVVSAEF